MPTDTDPEPQEASFQFAQQISGALVTQTINDMIKEGIPPEEITERAVYKKLGGRGSRDTVHKWHSRFFEKLEEEARAKVKVEAPENKTPDPERMETEGAMIVRPEVQVLVVQHAKEIQLLTDAHKQQIATLTDGRDREVKLLTQQTEDRVQAAVATARLTSILQTALVVGLLASGVAGAIGFLTGRLYPGGGSNNSAPNPITPAPNVTSPGGAPSAGAAEIPKASADPIPSDASAPKSDPPKADAPSDPATPSATTPEPTSDVPTVGGEETKASGAP
jgi:hypothetical protein